MGTTEKKYWKGLEEYNRDSQFESQKHNEFAEKLPVGEVLEENNLKLESNRRDFLKFMGFSISAATLAACTKTPVKKAVPWVDKPAEIDPGIANYYATTCMATNEAISVLVKTREGRPIKIEGNPDYPLTGGGTSAAAQASVLSLYDNGRLRGPRKDGKPTTWSSSDKTIRTKLEEIRTNGGNIRILSGTVNSPSTLRAIEEFKTNYPGTEHVMYDPVSAYGILAANKEAFNKPFIPDYKFEKAKAIVGINADFLGTWIAPVEYTKKYTEGRKVDDLKDMSYHVQMESTMSLTGANADMRVPVKPSDEGKAVLALHNAVASLAGARELPAAKFELAGNSIKLTAKQLWENRGESLVVCGSNDKDIQLVVNRINSMLGNYGKTLDFKHASLQQLGNDEAMAGFTSDMKNGNVDAVILFNTNPAYDYANAQDFTEGLKKTGLTVSFNERMDETSSLCTYVIPEHHYLEAWNDAQTKKGIYTLSQPTIAPIFKTRAAAESLLAYSGIDKPYYEYIKETWKGNLQSRSGASNFHSFWTKSLHDGFFIDHDASDLKLKPTNNDSTSAAAVAAAGIIEVEEAINSEPDYNNFNADISSNARGIIDKASKAKGIEVVLYQKVGILDGKHSNNPWLQELPDPISKATWDNYACMSPKMAKENGDLKDEDVISIKAGKEVIELPVLVQPGQPYGTIGIAVGYGHTYDESAGKVASMLGQNAYKLSRTDKGYTQMFVDNASITATGNTYPLARTQTHHHMEGRDLIREASLNSYVADPKSVEKKSHQLVSLYKDYNYGKGHHWAMAIDLNACTGCGACAISCQAENNVPVVGKEEVRRRREMHWIRIDRYFGGDDPENPTVNFQPVMCQHCDNAPCENVCPVAAIVHSDEGVNQQVYNRCVGTRYCANNCPYKVRRFNWFTYSENDKFDYNMNNDLGKMVLNPDVTVRIRGVMEKCSFCVQRIQTQKLEAKKEGHALKDGQIKTACQQACPADAIKFGDLNNPDSEVSKLVNKNHRSYTLLTNLNTRPSVNYMVKIRNDKQNEEA